MVLQEPLMTIFPESDDLPGREFADNATFGERDRSVRYTESVFPHIRS